jgi:hypothetical protein
MPCNPTLVATAPSFRPLFDPSISEHRPNVKPGMSFFSLVLQARAFGDQQASALVVCICCAVSTYGGGRAGWALLVVCPAQSVPSTWWVGLLEGKPPDAPARAARPAGPEKKRLAQGPHAKPLTAAHSVELAE